MEVNSQKFTPSHGATVVANGSTAVPQVPSSRVDSIVAKIVALPPNVKIGAGNPYMSLRVDPYSGPT